MERIESLQLFRAACLDGQGVDVPVHQVAECIVNHPVAGHGVFAGEGHRDDGEAEVLRRVREQLMLGATQIKMMAGGGVALIGITLVPLLSGLFG